MRAEVLDPLALAGTKSPDRRHGGEALRNSAMRRGGVLAAGGGCHHDLEAAQHGMPPFGGSDRGEDRPAVNQLTASTPLLSPAHHEARGPAPR